jgi:DNA-binding transcriptional regulator YhcF (GntR family)
MRKRSFEPLAAELEKTIREGRAFPFASINDIARGSGVSYRTAWKAVRLLVDKGIMTASAGKAVAVAPAFRGDAAVAPTVSGRVYAAIRRRILDGAFQVGKRLPKAEFFARSENASTLTISRILQQLASDNLLHKIRNRWYVGPAAAPEALAARSKTAHEAPVILVMNDHSESFFFTLSDTFAYSFLVPFSSEIMTHGIQLKPVQIAGAAGELQSLPTGIDEVKSIIRELGPRYCGTLTMTIYPELNSLGSWIAELAALGKPVVYFDYAEKGGFLSRKGLSAGRNFFRLHMDERAAVGLALDELSRHGHQTIGVHGFEFYDWAQRRVGYIEECAGKIDARPSIVRADTAERIWDPMQRASRFLPITHVVEAGMSKDRAEPVSADDLARRLIKDCPSFVSLLRDRRPTALIVMNDEVARDYYFWCRAVGMKVPDDLSIISFDNIFESMFFPVSTIDFGFARLGYCAAHIFINDIPVRADREGNIPGICTLIDRGSIGEPRGPEAGKKLARILKE